MSADSDLFRDAFELLVGEQASWIVGGEPMTFEEVLSTYSSREIAEAAGYSMQSKSADPAGWRRRQTFYRDLQRWRNQIGGTGRQSRRATAANRRLVVGAGITISEREATPGDLAGVLRLMRRHGFTTTRFVGLVRISDDISIRDVGNVFCPPGQLRAAGFFDAVADDDWERALGQWWAVWCRSYGLAGAELIELYEIELQIGRQPEQMSGRRRRAA